MNHCQQFILSFFLILIQPTSTCNPVNEYESRRVNTTNTSHLIGYRFPPCPTLYRLASIVRAELSSPASPTSTPLDITYLLTTAGCRNRTTTPCTVNIPLGSYAQGGNTALDVKVNYTCQLDDPGWIRSLMATTEKRVSQTLWVKYIRVKLTGAEVDWNCAISSYRGTAVTFTWMLENCPMKVLGCMNRTLTVLPRQSDTSLFCMETKSIGEIRFITEKFCDATMRYTSVVVDIQVPPTSDFDIVCNAETPSNIATNIENLTDPQLDPLRSKCSQLTGNDAPSLTLTSKAPSTSTFRGVVVGNSDTYRTTLTRSLETGIAVTAGQMFNRTTNVTNLGLGLGLGIGLLVVISAVALAVVCIRRKNRGFDAKCAKKSNLGGATAEKDGGFVLATDVFTVKNIYSEISEVNLNPHPTRQSPDTRVKPSEIGNKSAVEESNRLQDVGAEQTTENGFHQEPTPAATTIAASGDKNPKRPLSLSRKLFKQIAVLAKQEERQSQIPDGVVAIGPPEGAVEIGGSEMSIVDRWLYSSENTISPSNNDDNEGIYINRGFEMDI